MGGRTTRVAVAGAVALAASAGTAVAAVGPVPGGGAWTPVVERPSAPTAAAVEELLEVSGIAVQLEAIAAAIRVQFFGAPGRLSARDRTIVDRVAARHLSGATLYARMRLEVEQRVDAERLGEALAWYRSSLGRRFTRAEIRALSFAGEPVSIRWPSDTRIELVQRLDASGGATETAVDVSLTVVRSLNRAFRSFRPAHRRQTGAQLEARLARLRTEALTPTRIAHLRNMLFVYRGMTNAELEEYARFMESPAGQWYGATMGGALLDSVGAAADLAALEVVTLLPQLSGGLR